jgi:hypothetical protein
MIEIFSFENLFEKYFPKLKDIAIMIVNANHLRIFRRNEGVDI